MPTLSAFLLCAAALFIQVNAMPWHPVNIVRPRKFDMYYTRNHQLFEMVSDSSTVYVDVRDEHETLKPPYLKRPFVQVPIRTLGDASAIRKSKEIMAIEKSTPIVVFSGLFGFRAQRAKATMVKMGFTNVCNGGSINDVLDAVHYQENKEHKRSAWEKVTSFFETIGSGVLFNSPWSTMD